MAKVKTFFDHPVLKSILMAVIIAVIMGAWNEVKGVREEQIKQTEVTIHMQKNMESVMKKMEEYGRDITTLKVDVGTLKAVVK